MCVCVCVSVKDTHTLDSSVARLAAPSVGPVKGRPGSVEAGTVCGCVCVGGMALTALLYNSGTLQSVSSPDIQ